MDNCFYHLTHLPLLPKEYVDLASQSLYQNQNGDNTTWARCFDFENTPLFKKLTQDFQRVNVVFYRNYPKSFFSWHKDEHLDELRNCAINFVLSHNPGALTLFSVDHIVGGYRSIEVCNYTFLAPTLFNARVPHSVTNPTDSYRYILSIGI